MASPTSPFTAPALQPYQARVVDEASELTARIVALTRFLEVPPVGVDPAELSVLFRQKQAMMSYLDCLLDRLRLWAPWHVGNATAELVVGAHLSAVPGVSAPVASATPPVAAADLPVAPTTDDDFPLGAACDLSGDGTCDACQ